MHTTPSLIRALVAFLALTALDILWVGILLNVLEHPVADAIVAVAGLLGQLIIFAFTLGEPLMRWIGADR